jgi:hypothetical protein
MPYVFKRNFAMFGYSQQYVGIFPFVWQDYSTEEWADKRVPTHIFKPKYDPMSDDTCRAYTTIEVDLGFNEDDWVAKMWDPFKKREIINGMASWPDWPFSRYSWVELSEISAARNHYRFYTPQRLIDVMQEKYDAWNKQHEKGGEAHARVVYLRKFGDQEYRDKLARITRRPELANAEFFNARRSACLLEMKTDAIV